MEQRKSDTSGARAARKHRRKKKAYIESLNAAAQKLLNALVKASDEVQQMAIQNASILQHIHAGTLTSPEAGELMRRMQKRGRRAKRKMRQWRESAAALEQAATFKPRARTPNRPASRRPPADVSRRPVSRTTAAVIAPTVAAPVETGPPRSGLSSDLPLPGPRSAAMYVPQCIPLGAGGPPMPPPRVMPRRKPDPVPEAYDLDEILSGLDQPPPARPRAGLLAFIGHTGAPP